MNPDTNTINRASSAAVGFIAACLIFIGLAVMVKFAVSVPAIDADRNAVMTQALFQLRTNEVAALDHPGWIDRSRGIVRLPIDTAMQISAQEWQNPAQARADLLSRQENASKPVKPVSFE